MTQFLNHQSFIPHTQSRKHNLVMLGLATLLFSLLACHSKGPGSPELSDLKTDPAGTPTSPPFREDFVPTMDWTCKNTTTPNYEIFLKWKGLTDDKGQPTNAYEMVYKPNDPTNQGPKTVTTTMTLQTQYTPDSTWPKGTDGPLIRSFRFVGKIKSEENETAFDLREVINKHEEWKVHENIATRRFAYFKIEMSSFPLPTPGAAGYRRVLQCALSQVHLRAGEPIRLVHADDGGQPTIQSGKLLKVSDSQVDHIFSDGTIGSLGMGVQELKTAFNKNYTMNRFNTGKEIAVVSELGIYIGNVVIIPSKSRSANPPSDLEISNFLWKEGLTKGPSLILWDGPKVSRPSYYPKIKYRIYGPDDFISLEYKKLIIDLCQNRASPAVTCSKNEVDALLKNTDKAVTQIPRSIPRCSP